MFRALWLFLLATAWTSAKILCSRTVYIVPFYMQTTLAEEAQYVNQFLNSCVDEAEKESKRTRVMLLNLEKETSSKCTVGAECRKMVKDVPKSISEFAVRHRHEYDFHKFFDQNLQEKECLKFSKIVFITNARCLQLDRYPDFQNLLMSLDSPIMKMVDDARMQFHIIWINYDYLSPIDSRGCELGYLSKEYDAQLHLHVSKDNGTMLLRNVDVCGSFNYRLPDDDVLEMWKIIIAIMVCVTAAFIAFSCVVVRFFNVPYRNKIIHIGDEWEITIDQLAINKSKMLGSGAFAVVYAGHLKAGGSLKSLKQGDQRVAVKMLREEVDDSARSAFVHEINLMKRFGHHAHIINTLGCISDPANPVLVLEYCENGSLLSILNNDGGTTQLVSKELLSIAWQVSDGMCYLIDLGWLHRDLAARNVMVCKPLKAKISDFGLTISIKEAEACSTLSAEKLPVKWTAPEALNGQFSEKSDVWSFGILLFELYNDGIEPYPSIPSEMALEQIENGLRPQTNDNTPEVIAMLMSQCWHAERDCRPNFQFIRSQLTKILESDTQSYGYIDFGSSVTDTAE